MVPAKRGPNALHAGSVGGAGRAGMAARSSIRRNRGKPEPFGATAAATLEEFIARNQKAEAEVREFLERRNILTLPTWLQHSFCDHCRRTWRHLRILFRQMRLNGKCQSPCNAGSIWEWTMRCASLGGLK